VYTPLARPPDSLDCSSSGLPGTASTDDTPGTVRPFESRIRTSVSLGSGFSPKVITIVAGDCRREEPADGTELTRLAWASAAATGPARTLNAPAGGPSPAVLAALTLFVLFFGVYPAPLLRLVECIVSTLP